MSGKDKNSEGGAVVSSIISSADWSVPANTMPTSDTPQKQGSANGVGCRHDLTAGIENARPAGVAYLITCLENGKQYVGITTKPLTERWAQHRQRSKRGRTALGGAITEFGCSAFSIEVIASATAPKDLKALERLLIAQYATMAPNGYNLTGGGNGTLYLAPETRAKLSACLTGRPKTAEHVAAAAAGRLGIRVSEEGCAAMAAAQRGLKRSADAVAKSAASRTGLKQTDETKAKISLARRGKPLSDEHRRKLSIAKTGKTHTAQARANMAAGHVGIKHTLEARARMSEIAKTRSAIISAQQTGRKRSAEQKARMSQAKREGWARRKAAAASSSMRKCDTTG